MKEIYTITVENGTIKKIHSVIYNGESIERSHMEVRSITDMHSKRMKIKLDSSRRME